MWLKPFLSNRIWDDLDLPTIGEGDSVIYVMVSAVYKPMLVNELLGTFTLLDEQVRRPRFGLRSRLRK